MAWQQVIAWKSPCDCVCTEPEGLACIQQRLPNAIYPCICKCHQDTEREYLSPVHKLIDGPGEDEAWKHLE